MAALFKRVCELVVAKPVNGSFVRTSPISVVKISDLRVTFRVEKTLDAEPNSADVTVYNLNERSRGELQERPLKVGLYAGHNNSPKKLFTGDVFWSTSKRNAPEWVTELQAGDGQRAIRQSRVAKSYRAGLKVREAMREILDSMGFGAPANTLLMPELNSVFANGLVIEGQSHAELTKLLNKAGLRWSIQDDQIQILRSNGAAVEPALPISQVTGMIGSPEFNAPPKEGDPATITIRSILYPELVPGRLVLVDSLTAKGQFRVDRVTHTGDTHGDDWETEVQCRPM
jgi:hypothetical protein